MKTLDLIPEEVVSDFGIGEFIAENLSNIVNDLNTAYHWNLNGGTRAYANSLIQVGSDIEQFRAAMDKYRASFGQEISPDIFSLPVLDYIRKQALKSRLSIVE